MNRWQVYVDGKPQAGLLEAEDRNEAVKAWVAKHGDRPGILIHATMHIPYPKREKAVGKGQTLGLWQPTTAEGHTTGDMVLQKDWDRVPESRGDPRGHDPSQGNLHSLDESGVIRSASALSDPDDEETPRNASQGRLWAGGE